MQQDNIRKDILELVCKFYAAGKKADFIASESKINYAGRVFDEQELVNAVDASLDFWLTEGRFSEDSRLGVSQYIPGCRV